MERNKKGQFVKGMIPWNLGKRGYMGANRTSFTSQRVEQEATKYELFEAHKPDKDGWLQCRIEERKPVKNKHNGKIYMHRKRTSYAKMILVRMGIEVPKGCVVYHKDGDPSNNEIGNLEVITRAQLIKRNNPKINGGY